MVEKKNVLLVDAAGMSISLLAKKMDDYAEMNKLPYSVEGALLIQLDLIKFLKASQGLFWLHHRYVIW
ncbi:hypothetical protein [Oenococcus oeni]|uniref:hypothetical protein n=1 Tax=Oenococcus oeni TaxID=1247 RepID=UPI00050EA4D0|nr:hypothetical protein [Oenococcus oeni]KGH55085.1 hypothetical protein X463_06845 [Oenococcus oeni S22]OIK63182.1 hypothetical protein ATW62_03160 [Oenococcus oeni]OIK81656.1 hypothetical protein ATW73_03210 [Oenococcus oeni]OIL90681.1 hypothetical protein ATX42_03210 [Oenococcus oeni]OIM66573.1 hypothetical protein ATX88_03135 [Oenococcus oeni]